MATYVIEQDGVEYEITVGDAEPAPETSALEAAVHYAGQGATWGLTDELAGLGAAIIPGGRGYSEARDEYRDKLDLLKKNHPKTALAAELGGGFLVPGGTFGLAARGAANASRIGKVGKLAGIGAIEGGLAGLGYSDSDLIPGEEQDITGALADTVGGSLVGAVASPLLSGVIPAAAHIGRKTRDWATRSPHDKVVDMLSDELTPEVLDRYASMGPEAMLMDASDELMGLAGAAKDTSSRASRLIDDAIHSRELGAQGRVNQIVADASGTNPARYKADKKALETKRKRQARREYRAVNTEQVTVTPGIRDILEVPAINDLLPVATRTWQSTPGPDGLPIPGRATTDPLATDVVPLSFLDTVKKVANDKVQAVVERTDPNTMARANASNYTSHVNSLLVELDSQVPQYGRAREKFRTVSREIDAGVAGRLMQKKSDKAMEDAAELLPTLNPAEAARFRQGAAAGIIKDVRKAPGNRPDFARRAYTMVDGPTRDRLEMASQSPVAFANASRLLEGETQFKDTAGYLLAGRNSRTATRQGALNKANMSQQAIESVVDAIGDPKNAAKNAAYNLIADNFDPRTADRVAEALANPNITTDEIQSLIRIGDIPESIGQAMITWLESGSSKLLAGSLTSAAAGASAGQDL